MAGDSVGPAGAAAGERPPARAAPGGEDTLAGDAGRLVAFPVLCPGGGKAEHVVIQAGAHALPQAAGAEILAKPLDVPADDQIQTDREAGTEGRGGVRGVVRRTLA